MVTVTDFGGGGLGDFVGSVDDFAGGAGVFVGGVGDFAGGVGDFVDICVASPAWPLTPCPPVNKFCSPNTSCIKFSLSSFAVLCNVPPSTAINGRIKNNNTTAFVMLDQKRERVKWIPTLPRSEQIAKSLVQNHIQTPGNVVRGNQTLCKWNPCGSSRPWLTDLQTVTNRQMLHGFYFLSIFEGRYS